VIQKGIHYLDRETRTVAYYENGKGIQRPLKVYGNPVQPLFSGDPAPVGSPFRYIAYPSEEASKAWAGAPTASDDIQIWVMHSPPKDRLDLSFGPRMMGCVVEARNIASAKPLLCVFGHFHESWGVERVQWDKGTEKIANSNILTMSKERKEAFELTGPEFCSDFDFSGFGEHPKLLAKNETLFVNAAWMTTKKRKVQDRNQPISVTLPLEE
jgi:hypothetical protein